MKAIIEKLRELIQAEVQAGIVGSQEDEEGYFGSNYTEKKLADKVYGELCKLLEGHQIFLPSPGETKDTGAE